MLELIWHSLQHLIQTYPYLLAFLGSLIEGESIILTVSAFAATGAISIYKVGCIAFIGTALADQVLFWIGRRYGQHLLGKRAQEYTSRIQRLLNIRPWLFIMSFRFIYGIRIWSPIAIGLTQFPSKDFALLNLVAAVIWSTISCALGYTFGQQILHAYHISGVCLLIIYIMVIIALKRRLRL